MEHNRSTFSILFYLNTSKKKKSGKCPVMGRINVDGKSTAFSQKGNFRHGILSMMYFFFAVLLVSRG